MKRRGLSSGEFIKAMTIKEWLFLMALAVFLVILKNDLRSYNKISPIIYCITPTYFRDVEMAELTRISHLFLLVPNLFWVIVEDAEQTNPLIQNLLDEVGLANRSVLLHARTPVEFRMRVNDQHWAKPRGVEQRNVGLRWVKKQLIANRRRKSIVYFMDDDNTYSIKLFKEMLKIEHGRVGVWPVGLVGTVSVEGPIVENNKVVGFTSAWKPERPFPLDMAGFAISGSLFLKNPLAQFSYEVEGGYQETEILRQLTTREKLQPLIMNKVLVWHTRTEQPDLISEEKLALSGNLPSDQGF